MLKAVTGLGLQLSDPALLLECRGLIKFNQIPEWDGNRPVTLAPLGPTCPTCTSCPEQVEQVGIGKRKNGKRNKRVESEGGARKRDRQPASQLARQAGRRAGNADRHTGRQADRQTDKQAGRQAGKQTDRRTHTHTRTDTRTHTHTHLHSSLDGVTPTETSILPSFHL